MTKPPLAIGTLLLVLSSASGVVRAEPPMKLDLVSSTLAEMANQRAQKGRSLEQAGRFGEALAEYRGAIADLDKYFDKPSTKTIVGNPKPYLVRGGAEADAARALSRTPGHDPRAVAELAGKAEADFSTVTRLVSAEPASPENTVLLQKASLGRGYARLLSGNLQQARIELQGLKLPPSPAATQLQGTLVGLDKEIATQSKAPPAPDKLKALMNLGQQIVQTFLPKYQGLAVAVGDVAEAFRK